MLCFQAKFDNSPCHIIRYHMKDLPGVGKLRNYIRSMTHQPSEDSRFILQTTHEELSALNSVPFIVIILSKGTPKLIDKERLNRGVITGP